MHEAPVQKFDIDSVNALGARLFDHAESIENITAHDMERDLRLGARACDKLASLRFRIAEIAAMAHHHHDIAAVTRDLRDALAECE